MMTERLTDVSTKISIFFHIQIYDLQLSKRGKVASRPSQAKQLEQLQKEEKEYLAMMQAKNEGKTSTTGRSSIEAPSSSSQQQSNTSSPSSPSSSEASVPTQITDRMLRRMITFSIGPVFFGFLLFPAFYYLKKVQGIDVPVWAVYIVQTTIFGGGLLGISYGVISSSWDPRREGSFLGWNEFQANLPLLMDRFKKS
jgi:hypothetical protein